MEVDFSKITVYEIIALILSFIAIVTPIVQWMWRKWVVKAILNHLPTGKVCACFNRSGSYLKIESVYEALRKPVSVKHIAIKMTRMQDDKKLNQVWSSFWSPVTQNFKGSYSSTIEGAHPFRVEANSITTAFTEFEDPQNTLNRSIVDFEQKIDFFIKDCLDRMYTFPMALEEFKKQSFYSEMRRLLEQEFFWKIGIFKVDLIVKYNETEKMFSYSFEINERDYEKLRHNLEETLIINIKNAYQVKFDFQNVVLNLNEKI